MGTVEKAGVEPASLAGEFVAELLSTEKDVCTEAIGSEVIGEGNLKKEEGEILKQNDVYLVSEAERSIPQNDANWSRVSLERVHKLEERQKPNHEVIISPSRFAILTEDIA